MHTRGSFSHHSSTRGRQRIGRMPRGFHDINVTPLVDVMLVLLIVFMVAAPMLTVGVPVDLPKTQAAKLNDSVEPIVISIDAQGQAYLQETPLDLPTLVARLVAITGHNPEARIYVRGDHRIHYGRVLEFMGRISSAGFHKVSLLAELPKAPAHTAQKSAAHAPRNG